jgi:acetyl esterase/lipase
MLSSLRWRRVVLRIVCVALLLGLSACAWLTDQQRLMIYRPSASQAPELSTLPGVTDIYFVETGSPAAPARLALWWLAHPDPAAATLLYLHGTFRALPGNQAKIEALRTAGFSVLVVDYRGWGQSTRIVPSEESIQQDARHILAEMLRASHARRCG